MSRPMRAVVLPECLQAVWVTRSLSEYETGNPLPQGRGFLRFAGPREEPPGPALSERTRIPGNRHCNAGLADCPDRNGETFHGRRRV
jgi:hypothetical protein